MYKRQVPDGRFSIRRTAAEAVGIFCPGSSTNVNVTRIHGAEGTDASQFRCYVGGGDNNDTYNYSPFNLELTPQERGGLFVNGNYRLTDTVEAYVTAFTNKTRSRYIIAPLPLIVDLKEPDAWIADRFLRYVGRKPSATEATLFRAALSDPDGGPHVVIRALLTGAEYASR